MITVRFTEDDEYGAWRAGELAEDLGWESDHIDAPPIRLLKTEQGEVLALTNPYVRGLIEEQRTEVLVNGRWVKVTWWIFRSWSGLRRLNDRAYHGPSCLLGS